MKRTLIGQHKEDFTKRMKKVKSETEKKVIENNPLLKKPTQNLMFSSYSVSTKKTKQIRRKPPIPANNK